MKITKIQNVILPLVFLAAACGSGADHKTETTKSDTPVEEEVKTQETESTDRDVSIVFPSAVEIMTVFENAGLKYEKGLTLDPAHLNNFNTKFQKSIATGIYTADLAYCVVNNQSQEALKYLKSVIDISKKLGIDAISDIPKTTKDFEAALGDKEKTLDVLEKIQMETDTYVEDNGLQSLAVVIFSGAWLEGVYLAIETNEEWNNEELSDKMLDQMYVLENLLVSLESSGMTSADYQAYLASLKSLNESFSNMQNSSTEGEDLSLMQLKDLASQIVEIRKEHFLPH